MVDPNPARGMPIALQRYWIAGKGGAKIRWRMPHDFNRCVRNLRKYFPKNPEGLCNILHQKAVGAPPGKGHPGEASVLSTPAALVAAQDLMNKQEKLGQHLWAGPIAAIGRPTSEPTRTRIFEHGALSHRPLPLPFDFRFQQAPGHNGGITVGRVLGVAMGPNEAGLDNAYGWGDFFDEEIVPEAKRARYLMESGVYGASVDPGGRMVVTMNPETGFEHVTQYTIGGVTSVPIPAYLGMQLYALDVDGNWPDDDMDMVMDLIEEGEEDCGCGRGLTASVNPNGWKGLPLAMRNSVFDNDDAVKRITAWANGGQETEKMRQAFMYFDPQGNPSDPTSYRLPVGDVINGNLTLIYHAIYAAAALLSGAHGGLPNIPEQDKGELRNVISEIYAVMADEFGDSSIRAPWDRSAQEGVQMSVTASMYPLKPPGAWFQDPKLVKKTPLTVTEDGRVFGHLAAWGECHRDMAMRECVMAPKSHMEYAAFHLGNVVTAEEELVPVGKIVMDTRHADIRLGMTAAADHYDNTGREVAIIRAGEDEFGIWVAGSLVPEATPEVVAKLRRSPLSGDWRRQNGHLELTAALAVNAPAFPVYSMEMDEQWALVAAGSVYHEEPVLPIGRNEVLPNGGIDDLSTIDPTVLMNSLVAAVRDVIRTELGEEAEVQLEPDEDIAARFADILEDEDIYEQRDRAARLEALAAAASDPWTRGPQRPAVPAPAPGAAPPAGAGVPAPAAPGAPAPVAADPGAAQSPPVGAEDMGFVDRAAAGRYSIIQDPVDVTEDGVEEPEGEPEVIPMQEPVQPVVQ